MIWLSTKKKFNDSKNMPAKSQHQKRLEVIFFFYHHFVIRCSIQETTQYLKRKNFDHYQLPIINYILQHFNVLQRQIATNLSPKWTFAEISDLEKAILMTTIAEIYVHKVSKAIIISEAVKISRKYCLEKSYTYIHKVIDQIFQ